MKADLLIVDYMKIGFNRYANEIVQNLKSFDSLLKIVAVYVYEDMDQEISSVFDDSVHVNKDYNVACILEDYQPHAVLTFAFREYDMAFTIQAKKQGILTINVQHSLYRDVSNPPNKYTMQYIWEKIVSLRKNEYFKSRIAGLYQCVDNNIARFLSLLRYLLPHRNILNGLERIYEKEINTDICFVFGESYVDYFKRYFLQNESKYFIVGYPELERDCKNVVKGKHHKATVIWLDELELHGEELVMIMMQMVKLLDQIELVIKKHPLSDNSKYSFLKRYIEQGEVSFWQSPEFPVADAYIGYSSTIMVRAMYLTDKVCCIRFGGMDSPYKEYTEYYVHDNENLFDTVLDMLNRKKTDYIRPNSLEKIAFKNKGDGALMETAKVIGEYLHHGI